jgi:hypothetical protein
MDGPSSKCRENEAMGEGFMSCEAQKLGSWERHGVCFVQRGIAWWWRRRMPQSSTFFDAVPAEISLSSRFAHRLPYGFRVNVQLNKEYTLQAGNTMISFMSQIFSMVGITLKSFYCLA